MAHRFTLLFAAWLCLVSVARSEDAKPAELNSIRMYIPIPQVEERFGADIGPLAKYMKTLEKRLGEILAKEEQPQAKGLLIAVGIKSRKITRIWCQAVEGDAPPKLLLSIERELAKIEAVDLKQSPAAFTMEINLFGQKPDKYPEFAQSWWEAATKHKTLLMPPDDLFKIIWPD